MIRYFIIVDGRVQGVGFRYTVQRTALKLGLTGSVRNLENGMVEIYIQGTEDKLNKFIQLIKEGNRFIRVEDISIKKIYPIEGEKNFKVDY